jgi:hypothetical protein
MESEAEDIRAAIPCLTTDRILPRLEMYFEEIAAAANVEFQAYKLRSATVHDSSTLRT